VAPTVDFYFVQINTKLTYHSAVGKICFRETQLNILAHILNLFQIFLQMAAQYALKVTGNRVFRE